MRGPLRPVLLQGFERAAAHFRMARFLIMAQFVARILVERRQQVEGDFGRMLVGMFCDGQIFVF
jgi:hypothetical protein